MKYRRIEHLKRGIWYISYLESERCVHSKLKEYVKSIENYSGRYQMAGKRSASEFSVEMPKDIISVPSPYNEYFWSLKNLPQKKMHLAIEKMFLNVNRSCVATELPLSTKFNEGLIDIVLDTKEAVYILDYKPEARKANALGQVSAYAMMLSQLTGLGLEDIRVGWFDEDWYYETDPVEVKL